ncbi:hypothetical protein F751_1438 [Auxenochlorella protothecoides]|uniref:Uncharacterized protein n=1 Tax=Auxenochlorella protothecoides TaxID=3075 RepID=A0A087SJC0_AUXPR|nr:hypothetical protein F751_1438 [Auxenochlorella protothecoides]KFM25824.1 hypothetical protein F751_1438 [Auxenochlorella protothecoides]RMZ55846.1 hypothetical protein APUTEX25_003812 [Auxenochlorella protothecoides]|eukprot:RMZ55846.1 hypothetical protein APUTEX25_003812 [Auxenochlorella protothecoides]
MALSSLQPRLVHGGFSLPTAVTPRPRQRNVQTTALFSFLKLGSKTATKPKYETVIPETSYAIPAVLLGEDMGWGRRVFLSLGLLGAFLAVQASRVKFVFDEDALEVLTGKDEEESENAFVGGRNRWSYDSIINWEFWFPSFPILVYFKEDQTRPEGQIHFFPVLFNGKQLFEVMSERFNKPESD